MKFQAIIDDIAINISIKNFPNFEISCNNNTIDIDCQPISSHSFSLIINGKSHFLSIYPNQKGYDVKIDQSTNAVTLLDEQELLLKKFGFESKENTKAGEIIAQIPGLISQIFVSSGENIKIGDKLFILEAMKMENEINSHISGTVKKIFVKSDDTVEKGTLIMEIEQ